MTSPFKFVLANTKDQWPFNKCEGDYSIPSTSNPAVFLLSFTQGHELGRVLLSPLLNTTF